MTSECHTSCSTVKLALIEVFNLTNKSKYVTEFCVTTASIRLGVRVTTTSCLDGRIATAGVSCSGVVIRTDSCLYVRADSCVDDDAT